MTAAHPESRFEARQTGLSIAPPVKRRLEAIKATMEGAKVRQVTYNELLDTLVDRWHATGGYVTEVPGE